MIDINLLRKNPNLIIENYKKRLDNELINRVKKLIELDKKWRENKKKEDELRKKRNLMAKKLSKSQNEGEIKKLRFLKKEIDKLTQENKILKEKIDKEMLYLPNLLHETVPIGKDENDNIVIKIWGEKPDIPNAKDHIDLMKEFDLFDIKRASKISGARFYFLKNEAVLLEQALIKFALDELIKKGFTLLIPPYMLRHTAMQGAGWLPVGEEDVYKIEGKDLYLIGTAEQPIASYHMNEILSRDELPKYYCGISPCFRTEAGAHGRDTKGIFRVHQFEKVEMFMFTAPDESWKEHEKLIKFAEEFQQKLGIHYRVVNICSGEMGMTAAKKYDIEAWFPGQKKYREVVSCSNCTDYQARRLNIKFVEKHGANEKLFVHTLNSTALAISRSIVCIVENNQTENSIKIPKVLQPYLGFKEIIK